MSHFGEGRIVLEATLLFLVVKLEMYFRNILSNSNSEFKLEFIRYINLLLRILNAQLFDNYTKKWRIIDSMKSLIIPI